MLHGHGILTAMTGGLHSEFSLAEMNALLSQVGSDRYSHTHQQAKHLTEKSAAP